MPETNCNMLAWFALLRICRNSRLPERREVSFCYGLRFISSPHAESSVLPSSVCVCSIATVSRNKSSFLLLPPSIHLSAAVDWPCQSAHYRHLPSPGSAHLISLARPRPLPSFTFSLLLLILARRDFGLFCGIGANSSSLLPFSFRRRRRQLCPSPPRSSPEEERRPTWCQRDAEGEGSPSPAYRWMDGWIGVLVNWRCFRHSSLPPPLPIVSRCQMSIDDAAVAVGAAAGDPCGPAAGARAGPLPRR